MLYIYWPRYIDLSLSKECFSTAKLHSRKCVNECSILNKGVVIPHNLYYSYWRPSDPIKRWIIGPDVDMVAYIETTRDMHCIYTHGENWLFQCWWIQTIDINPWSRYETFIRIFEEQILEYCKQRYQPLQKRQTHAIWKWRRISSSFECLENVWEAVVFKLGMRLTAQILMPDWHHHLSSLSLFLTGLLDAGFNLPGWGQEHGMSIHLMSGLFDLLC